MRLTSLGCAVVLAILTSAGHIGDRGQVRAAERMVEKDKHKNDFRTSIHPPYRGGKLECKDEPDDETILRATIDWDQKPSPGCTRIRSGIRIVKKRIVNRLDPPRFFPLVGPAQLHHCHWKCNVSYKERITVGYPFPLHFQRSHSSVVYIDKDHLHLWVAPGKERVAGINARP